MQRRELIHPKMEMDTECEDALQRQAGEIPDSSNERNLKSVLYTEYLTRNEIIRHMSVLGFELKDAEDPLGCKDLALSLVSIAAEEAEKIAKSIYSLVAS